VALKTDIPGRILANKLNFGVDIYNIVYVGSVTILIVNSEYQMEMLRMCLSKLFNTERTFDIYGEGFSVELCIDHIISQSQYMPLYIRSYQDIGNQRIKAMKYFNESVCRTNTLDKLIKGKNEKYIEWIVNYIVDRVFIELNFIEPNFYIHDKIKTSVIKILTEVKYNINGKELSILRDIDAKYHIENKTFMKLLDYHLVKCDLLYGTQHFIKFPRNKHGRICTQNKFCNLHSKGYITNSSIRTEKINIVLTNILNITFYSSIYKLSMLYFYKGVKNVIHEYGIIRLILDMWLRD
jgi:hypothetical protein